MLRCCVAGLLLVLSSGPAFSAERAEPTPSIDPVFDYDSYANVDQFRVTHLELDLRVDFVGQDASTASRCWN